MSNKNIIDLCKYLVSVNRDLIERTALKNCHCIGLNSFIINENPRMRLFIADDDCELYSKFDFSNPIIPIHTHKYDDLFFTLEGRVNQHLYTEDNGASADKSYGFFLQSGTITELNKYEYNRLSDNKTEMRSMGMGKIYFHGSTAQKTYSLKSNILHTVTIEKERHVNFSNEPENLLEYIHPKCSWLLIETFKDNHFKSIGYFDNINKMAGKQYYLPFENSHEYVSKYINNLK